MLLDKVLSNVHACKIEISFTGQLLASNIAGWQPFYNSTFTHTNFQNIYATLSSIDFSEESTTGTAGTSWKQKATFTFPENDKYRSERIALIHTIKYLKFTFTNGLELVIGRNDFSQNTLPTVKNISNGQLCRIEIESQSIFPSGFVPSQNAFGLPSFVPLRLIN